MKKTLIAIALIATSFVAQADTNLRDKKESELTYQQKKDLFAKMSAEELHLLEAYSIEQYRQIVNNEPAQELSINEKIDFVKEQINNNKKVVAK